MHEMQTIAIYDPVAWCVCQSVHVTSFNAPAPCKNSWTDRGPVWCGGSWGRCPHWFDTAFAKLLCRLWQYYVQNYWLSEMTKSRAFVEEGGSVPDFAGDSAPWPPPSPSTGSIWMYPCTRMRLAAVTSMMTPADMSALPSLRSNVLCLKISKMKTDWMVLLVAV